MPFKLNFSNPADRIAAEQAVFGRQLENVEYLELTGNMLEFCDINVAFNEAWSKAHNKGWNNGCSAIRIQAKNPICTTVVRMVPGHFDFSSCNVCTPKKGIGTIVLWRVARTAAALGFKEIEGSAEKNVNASGQLKSCGHLVYPKLGFDAPIPLATPPRPPALQPYISVAELIADPAGAAFWDANGVSIPEIVFDLTPDSASWRTLLSKLI